MMSQYNEPGDTAAASDVTCVLKSTIKLWKILVTISGLFEIKRETEREREREREKEAKREK